MPVNTKVSNIICQEVAISTNKFWCLVDNTTIDEYVFNPAISPFTFTPFYNQTFNTDSGETISSVISTLNDSTLISVNETTTPNKLCYVDLTSNPVYLDDIADIRSGWTASNGILYVKNYQKVILTITNGTRYNICQYDLSTNLIDVEYDISECMSASSLSTIYESESDSSVLYILTSNGNTFGINYSDGAIEYKANNGFINYIGSGQFESDDEHVTDCVPYPFTAASAPNIIYGFWVGTTNPETEIILFSDQSFMTGLTLYTNYTLSTIYGGTRIIYSLDEYTVSSGVIGPSTPWTGPYPTPICLSPVHNWDINNILSTNVLVTVTDAFSNSLTVTCPPYTTLNICSCTKPVCNVPISVTGSGGSCPW